MPNRLPPPAGPWQAWAVLALLLGGGLGGCHGGPLQRQPISEQGKLRCEGKAQREGGVIKRWLTYNQCLGTIEQQLAQERAVAARRQAAVLAQRLAFCQRTRPRSSELVAQFRRELARLEQLRAERYRPTPGPRPLDPVVQSKLPIYDQELDQERHARAVQAWRAKEAARSRSWAAEHGRQLDSAQRRLTALAQDLRGLNPALLAKGSEPGLDPQAVRRFADCRPEDFR